VQIGRTPEELPEASTISTICALLLEAMANQGLSTSTSSSTSASNSAGVHTNASTRIIRVLVLILALAFVRVLAPHWHNTHMQQQHTTGRTFVDIRQHC
jgi:hypothetical protein